MEKEIFWISITFSLIFLFLAIFSTRFFAASIGLALVAVLIHHSEEQESRVDKKKVHKNLDRIENLTSKLFNHLNHKTKNLDKEVTKTSQKMEKIHKDKKNMKGEVDRKLDKMARKLLEIENKVNNSKVESKKVNDGKMNSKKPKKNISPFSLSDSIEEMVKKKNRKK